MRVFRLLEVLRVFLGNFEFISLLYYFGVFFFDNWVFLGGIVVVGFR